MKIPKVEQIEPIDWNKFMNRLIGLDEWIAKYRKQHYENRRNNK